MLNLRFASWNVVTLYKNQTAVLNKLNEKNIDIACLQETRLLGNNEDEDSDNVYNVYSKGRDKKKWHGVGFAIKKQFKKDVDFELDIDPSERLYYMSLKTSQGNIHIINAYAPTELKSYDLKDEFYQCLENKFSKIPESEMIFIIGDFNAQVGADYKAWPTCLGKYGVKEMNDNGQRLLEFCSGHGLCITNTYLEVAIERRTTRLHPNGVSWSQLDLCITRYRDRNYVIKTEASSDKLINFDHRMIIIDIRIEKTQTISVDVEISLNQQVLLSSIVCKSYLVNKQLPVTITEMWAQIRIQILKKLEIKKISAQKETNMEILTNILTEMNSATANLRDQLKLPDAEKENLKTVFKNGIANFSKVLIQRNKNDHIDEVNIEENVNISDETLHSILVKGTSESVNIANTVKRVSVNVRNALSEIPDFNFLDTIDFIINKYEHNLLIPVTLLKELMQGLEIQLLEFFNLCWTHGYIPLELSFIKLIQLYFYPVVHSSNHLEDHYFLETLTFISDLCETILLQKMESFAQIFNRTSHSDIQVCLSKQDFLFSLNLLQDKFHAKNMPLFIAFVDLSKDCMEINTKICFDLLHKLNLPQNLISLLYILLDSFRCSQCSNDTPFIKPIITESDRNIIDVVCELIWSQMIITPLDKTKAIGIKTNLKDQLFSPFRWKTENYERNFYLNWIIFGRYVAFFAESAEDIQKHLYVLEKNIKDFKLRAKTFHPKIIAQNIENVKGRTIMFCGQSMNVQDKVQFFNVYYSSVKPYMDTEICSRISNMCKVMRKLQTTFTTHDDVNERFRQYLIRVLRPLLQYLETSTINSSDEDKLNKFHSRIIGQIIGRGNSAVESTLKVFTKSVQTILSYKRLILLGNWYRMKEACISKLILYGDLVDGTRKQGGQPLNFLSLCKRDFKKFKINEKQWESEADDKISWDGKLLAIALQAN